MPSTICLLSYVGASLALAFRSPSNERSISLRSRDADPFDVAKHVLPLKMRSAKSPAMQKRQQSVATQSVPERQRSDATQYAPVNYHNQFASVQVTVRGQDFYLQMAFASGDTWIAGEGFVCTDGDSGATVAQDECDLAPALLQGGFSGGRDNTSYISAYYTNGFAIGPAGYDDITIAGITVKNAFYGIADKVSAGSGDGSISGSLGLDFPAGTCVQSGPDDSNCQHYQNTFINTLFAEVNIPKVFSIAFERPVNPKTDYRTGSLAFGGRAPVPITGPWITVPTVQIGRYNSPDNDTLDNVFWTVVADSITFDSETIIFDQQPWSDYTNLPSDGVKVPFILDPSVGSGTLPKSILDNMITKFDPPGIYDETMGLHLAPCNATAPELKISIGGQTILFNEDDVILRDYELIPVPGFCVLAFRSPDPSDERGYLPILSIPFFSSVVTVLDPVNLQVSFAQSDY